MTKSTWESWNYELVEYLNIYLLKVATKMHKMTTCEESIYVSSAFYLSSPGQENKKELSLICSLKQQFQATPLHPPLEECPRVLCRFLPNIITKYLKIQMQSQKTFILFQDSHIFLSYISKMYMIYGTNSTKRE